MNFKYYEKLGIVEEGFEYHGVMESPLRVNLQLFNLNLIN